MHVIALWLSVVCFLAFAQCDIVPSSDEGPWTRMCDQACREYRFASTPMSLDAAKRRCQLDVDCPGVVQLSRDVGRIATCVHGTVYEPLPGACVERKKLALPSVGRQLKDVQRHTLIKEESEERYERHRHAKDQPDDRDDQRPADTCGADGDRYHDTRWQIWHHLRGPRPRPFAIGIPVVSLCAVAVFAISIPGLLDLLRHGSDAAPAGVRATQMFVVAAVPLVVVVLKLMVVAIPVLWHEIFFVAAVYEVYAFWTFQHLLIGFVAAEPKEFVEVLGQGSPSKMWAVVPFTCCFRCCVSPRHPTDRDVKIVQALIWQFIFITPTVAAAEMLDVLPEKALVILTKIETPSLMLAMFAIFALLEATHEVSSERRSHAKFWSIKGTFIANIFLFRVACWFMVDEPERIGQMCYSTHMLAVAQASTMTAVCAVPLSMLSRHAYRIEDLREKERNDDVHGLLGGAKASEATKSAA